MSDNECVVFEYGSTMGGLYGCRFTSPIAFSTAPTDGTHVLKTGLTMDEAQNLLSLTPEICSITGAIEEGFVGDQFSRFQFDNALGAAIYAIKRNRLHITEKHLERENADQIINFWLENKPDNPNKKRLITIAKTFAFSPHGHIQIKEMLEELRDQRYISAETMLLLRHS